MQSVTIRPMLSEDLPSVLEMVHALAAHHGDQAIADLETLQRDGFGPTPWVTFLVAEQVGALVGYAALCPLAQVQYGARGMDMQNLFVIAEARRQGVGAELITGCQAHSKALGCSYLAVGTHPDNREAQQVYLDLGFEQRSAPGPRFGKRL